MAHLATYVGCIYVAPVDDNGSLTGPWEMLGEAYPLSLQLTDADPTIVNGRTCDTQGKLIGAKRQPGEATGSLTMHEYSVENVARALKGVVTTNAKPEKILTDIEIDLLDIGQFIDIGEEDLTGVTVKSSTGAVLTAGTDYKINQVLGIITPLTESVANTTVIVNGVSSGNTGTLLTIGAGSPKKHAMKGNMINEFTGEGVKIYLRKVLISSNAEIVFVSEEDTNHEIIEMTLTTEIPTGMSDYGTIGGLPMMLG